MPFGGAGPLHACAMAAELGIARVLCPRASGVLCALGLAAAAPRHDVSRTVMLGGAELTRERLREARDELVAEADGAARRRRVPICASPTSCAIVGQSFELSVEAPEPSDPPANCGRRQRADAPDPPR